MAGSLEDNNYRNDSADNDNSDGDYFIDQNSNSERQEMIKSDVPYHISDKKRNIALKSIYFSLFSCLGVIASFFPLYFKALGLSPSIIGIVLFFRPVGGFVAGIVSPTIVSKFRQEWKPLMGFAIFFVVFMFSVDFLPSASFKESCRNTSFNLTDPKYKGSDHVNKNLSKFVLVKTSTHDISHGKNMPGTVGLAGSGPNADKRTYSADSISNYTGVVSYVHTLSNNENQNYSPLLVPKNVTFTVIVLAILMFCGEFCFVSLIATVNGITMRSLGKGNSKQFGVIRSWGAIGHGIGAFVTGAGVMLTVHHVTVCGKVEQREDYQVMFYVFLCLGLLTCLNAKSIVKSPLEGTCQVRKGHPSGDLRHALCTVRNLTWLFVLFSRSMFYAVTQGFLYWHMDNIGASPFLIGLANFITTITEFLTFFATPKLIETFGEAKIVGVGIVSYICRFVVFSMIVNPIFILPVEVLEGVTFACIWSSILSYLSRQVSQEAQTHISGLVQALFMSGASIGYPLSGFLIQVIGSQAMFLTFAAMASVTLVIFCLAHLVS